MAPRSPIDEGRSCQCRPFIGRRGKGPHPHTFSFTKKTARFTKGRFRPYEGQDFHSCYRTTRPQKGFRRVSEGVCLVVKPGSFVRTKSALSKTGRFLSKRKVWGWGPFFSSNFNVGWKSKSGNLQVSKRSSCLHAMHASRTSAA